MGLKLITPPAVEPVDLATAKAFIRVDDSIDDALIPSLIAASRRRYDGPNGILGRALITQTWDYAVDAFPSGNLQLPLTPVQSITSVAYTDSAGASVTLDTSEFGTSLIGAPAFVYPSAAWPAAGSMPGSVVLRFVVGYGDDPSDVPPEVILAILTNVAAWYEDRELMGKAFPGDEQVSGLWALPV